MSFQTKIYFELHVISISSLKGVVLVNITFLCKLKYLIKFQAYNTFFCILSTSPTLPYGVEDYEKMTFLCRCGHFFQFLTKYFCLELTPHFLPTQSGWWLANMTYLCQSKHFMQFLPKMFWNWLPHHTPTLGVHAGEHFSISLDISFNSKQKYFCKLTPHSNTTIQPLPHGAEH